MVVDSDKVPGFKERRIRSITLMYYSRPDIKAAIFSFAKDRETVPRYYDGFGKRPDTFQYENEIHELVRKGATSFHCSEELWEDPLEISTDLKPKEYNELRKGWDLLLDIDSPYLEYSKIYADLLINVLKKVHNIENVGVKFSGSKGFHIILPWEAFPKEFNGVKTSDMFPEWPRIICRYLADSIQENLSEQILADENLADIAKKTGKSETDLLITECASCKRPAIKKGLITWICSNCKNEITVPEGFFNNRKKAKCPDCRKELYEKSRVPMFVCEFCNMDSRKNPDMFAKKDRFATEKLIDADLVLVSPRHLFRMPYSLHEKTALASVVIEKENIKDFQIPDAQPMKVIVHDFYPKPRVDEAKGLLERAIEWDKENLQKEEKMESVRDNLIRFENQIQKSIPKGKGKTTGEYSKVVIEEPDPKIFPPHIKLLLKGIGSDGRKRALFILLSFFYSLGANQSYIEKTINAWNDKNYNPLKKGYIQAQFSWYQRNPDRFPPNFDNPLYKELNVDKPDELSKTVKNPVSYAIKKYFMMKN